MSANLPTVVAKTPPILAVNEQEPNPTFLQNKIESFKKKKRHLEARCDALT